MFRIRSLSGRTLSGSRSSTTVEPPNSNLPFSSPRFTWQRSFYNSGSFRPSVHRLPSSGRCRVFHFYKTVFSAVHFVDRADIICNRIYSMKNSRNSSLIGLFSIRHVAISVVIVYCKTDYYRPASPYNVWRSFASRMRAVGCIWCMLNEESSVFVNWIDTHFPVTWTDQYGIFPC